jgi:hypothetical protein
MKEKIGLHLQRDNNGKKDKFDVTYINLIKFIVRIDEIFAYIRTQMLLCSYFKNPVLPFIYFQNPILLSSKSEAYA